MSPPGVSGPSELLALPRITARRHRGLADPHVKAATATVVPLGHALAAVGRANEAVTVQHPAFWGGGHQWARVGSSLRSEQSGATRPDPGSLAPVRNAV